VKVFTIIVNIATILGLIIAIIQLFRSSSASSAARKAAEEARDRVNQTYLTPGIAVLIQHVRFVQEKAQTGQFDVARIRLHDVKDGLSIFYGSDFVQMSDLQSTIRQIDLCLRAIDRELADEGELILPSFCADLEMVVTQIQKIQSQIY
jgi:hypothetical protein